MKTSLLFFTHNILKNLTLLNYASTKESNTPKAFEKLKDPKKSAIGGAVATVGILLILRAILGL